jgi:hypothetical protein
VTIANDATRTTRYATRTRRRWGPRRAGRSATIRPGHRFLRKGRRRFTSWMIRVADEMRAELRVVDCCSLEVLLICADDVACGVPDGYDGD